MPKLTRAARKQQFSVLLADDHPVVREGVRSLLADTSDLCVVGAVGNGAQAISAAERLRPDVVVMGITMPGVNGIDATRAIIGKRPATGILMLSMHSSAIIVRRAIDAGARGYLVKQTEGKEVVKAIRTVASGKTYYSQELPSFATATGREPRPGRRADELTQPEREILKHVAEGKSNPQIASIVGLTRRTVETYRLRLMRKLHMENLPSLVKYAIRNGIVTLD